ncbi:hypothetical protein DSM07_01820 [Oenococcus sp. UCMA 16435]|nr:hypothetical protein DSM07_01820 [Oenococcus sp. UCMA 16435]MDI4584176.1 hypothetical protein [Oenococcus sp. UCMA 14587]
MYDGRPFFQLFLLLKKGMIATIAMIITMVLMLNDIENYPISKMDGNMLIISIYGAITVALLNVFQAICIFIYLNNAFRLVYVISSYISNALLVIICTSRVNNYSFMYLGIFAGLLGIFLLTYQIWTEHRYYLVNHS